MFLSGLFRAVYEKTENRQEMIGFHQISFAGKGLQTLCSVIGYRNIRVLPPLRRTPTTVRATATALARHWNCFPLLQADRWVLFPWRHHSRLKGRSRSRSRLAGNVITRGGRRLWAGGTLGKFRLGSAACFFKSLPYFRRNEVIFPTKFRSRINF